MIVEKKYKGIIVPAITPLQANYDLDEGAVEKLFHLFYLNGVDPFILGTTGEAASLSLSLKNEYVKKAGAIKRAGTKLYVGISSTVLHESISQALFAFENGADAVAATLPSYYQLSERQMGDYFVQLADAIRGPLIVYNIPATTHMSIPVSLIDKLSRHPNIVAVKDSERSDERLNQSLALWKDRPDFSYLLGWAARSDKALLQGGDGLIPSTGNFAPEIYATMWKAAQAGDQQKTERIQQLSDGYGNIYQKDKTLGESLWALKVVLSTKGICGPVVMPPLQGLSETEKNIIIRNWQELHQEVAI